MTAPGSTASSRQAPGEDREGRPAWRLSGAGNDFIALAEPAATPDPATVRAWCRRGLSLGADGVFRLRRASKPVADPGEDLVRDGVEVEMVHWNADGGRAELCVNGARCAARLAFHLGWARQVLTLQTDSGPVVARDAGGDRVSLEIAAPGEPEPLVLVVDDRPWSGHRLVVGGPHFVLAWDGDLGEAPVATLGAALRRHPHLGEAGANVHFVAYPGGAGADRRRFALRSFERGVEAETLACGSGVLATAAVAAATGAVDLPATAVTGGGFELQVGPGDAAGATDRWPLTGDARLLAELRIFPAAESLPAGSAAT